MLYNPWKFRVLCVMSDSPGVMYNTWYLLSYFIHIPEIISSIICITVIKFLHSFDNI